MAKSAAEVSDLFLRTARAVEQGKKQTITDAALVAKDIMNESVTRAGLPPGSSFRGKPGVFKGAYFNVRGKTNPVALVGFRPLGVAVLWDAGSKKHTIVSKKAGGTAKSRGAMTTGPGMFGQTSVSFTRTAGKGKAGPGIRRGSFKTKGAIRTPMGIRSHVDHPGQRGRNFGRGMNARLRKAMPEVMGDSTMQQIARAGWRTLR